jgi:hypothetical protein
MTAVSVPARGALRRRRWTRGGAIVSVDGLLSAVAGGEWGFVIGQRVSGEPALPSAGRALVLSPQRLVRHVLVMGATGAGKTETAMRLAHTIASETDAPVFYLDGKGDRQGAERFLGLMNLAGRSACVFPLDAFDGWRGEPHEIQNRLVEIIDYSAEGPAAWYRDVAKTALMLACQHPDGPPRSSQQLLERLDVRQVRLRYEAFFGSCRGQLDGTWAWEDVDAAYLLIDSLALKDEAGSLARFLFEDFTHFFTKRKPRERFCVLIVDEFSALADAGSMASRIEQARGFNTALVLAPQVAAGMGDDTEAARIMGSAETVICHRVNTPEEIVALAGTRLRMEHSVQYSREGTTGVGTARRQHQYKIDPNSVRALKNGEAYVISCGLATKARIARAPEAMAPLPAIPSQEQDLQCPVPVVLVGEEEGPSGPLPY